MDEYRQVIEDGKLKVKKFKEEQKEDKKLRLQIHKLVTIGSKKQLE